jgi:hypothetical protein
MGIGAVSAGAVSAAGTGSAIAVSVLSSTESAEKTQIATLFSSIGLGANVNASV